MSRNSADFSSYITTSTLFASRYGRPSKGCKLRLRRLNMRRRSSKEAKRKEKIGVKGEIELMNLKLYRENQSIIEQNEKLRRKALLLRQENQSLLSQLETKFPHYSPNQLPDNHDHHH